MMHKLTGQLRITELIVLILFHNTCIEIVNVTIPVGEDCNRLYI